MYQVCECEICQVDDFNTCISCKHENWVVAGYPHQEGVYRVTSIYDVYCLDCENFINLLSGKTINDKGLCRI